MIEVKSAASVKDYYRDDIAVQSYIATACGVPLSSVSLAHIDTSFVYQGDGDYSGLFHRADLTEEAMSRHDEVEQWLSDAHEVADRDEEPDICTGATAALLSIVRSLLTAKARSPSLRFLFPAYPAFQKPIKSSLLQMVLLSSRMCPRACSIALRRWFRKTLWQALPTLTPTEQRLELAREIRRGSSSLLPRL